MKTERTEGDRERKRGKERENKFEANSTVTSSDRVRRVQFTAWLY